MIKNPNCKIAVKIGILYFCSLGKNGDVLCRLQSDKTKAKGCQWFTPTQIEGVNG